MHPFILQHNIDIIKIFYLVKNFSLLDIKSDLLFSMKYKISSILVSWKTCLEGQGITYLMTNIISTDYKGTYL